MSCASASAPLRVLANSRSRPGGSKMIDRRGVVDRVAVRARAGLLLVEHLELLRGARGRLRVAAEAEEARVERRHVLRQQLRRVALGIDRDEQHLHPLAVGAELAFTALQLGQRRRAHVRALREAEEHHDDLALEVGERARLAVVVGQAEARGRTPRR